MAFRDLLACSPFYVCITTYSAHNMPFSRAFEPDLRYTRTVTEDATSTATLLPAHLPYDQRSNDLAIHRLNALSYRARAYDRQRAIARMAVIYLTYQQTKAAS